MKLDYVSLTGADDAVSVSDLNEIAAEFPFVEFAVLLLPEKAGQPRFPSRLWIENFKNHYRGSHKALHLCGSGFLRFLKDDPEILEIMKEFSRIQLNLKFGDVEGQYDVSLLTTQMKKYPQWCFIIQYTADKAPLLPLLQRLPNHAVLFDDSAGSGVNPVRWPPPLPGHVCGYAGGLNPQNITEHLEKIAKVVKEYRTWVDMETGIRTEDHFDLKKGRLVLAQSRKYCDEDFKL